MQVIRTMAISADRYLDTSFQQGVTPPPACPSVVWRALSGLWVIIHGILLVPKIGSFEYQFDASAAANCHRTVSILPSFAQPYRLVEKQRVRSSVADRVQTERQKANKCRRNEAAHDLRSYFLKTPSKSKNTAVRRVLRRTLQNLWKWSARK